MINCYPFFRCFCLRFSSLITNSNGIIIPLMSYCSCRNKRFKDYPPVLIPIIHGQFFGVPLSRTVLTKNLTSFQRYTGITNVFYGRSDINLTVYYVDTCIPNWYYRKSNIISTVYRFSKLFIWEIGHHSIGIPVYRHERYTIGNPNFRTRIRTGSRQRQLRCWMLLNVRTLNFSR